MISPERSAGREGGTIETRPGPLGIRYPVVPEVRGGRFQYRADEVIEKPFNWSQFARLLSYLRPYGRQVALALFLMLLVTGVQVAVPWVIKLAVDGALASLDKTLLARYALVYLMLHIVTYVSMTLRIRTTARMGQHAIHDLRHSLFEHIQGLSSDFFDARSVGKVLVRIVNDVNSLQDLLSNGVISAMTDILMLAGILFIMLSMHWKLSLATFILLPFMFVLSTRLRLRIRRAWQQVRVRISNINAHLNESIQGVRVTQAFAQERPNMSFFAGMNYDNLRTWMHAIRQDAMFRPLVEFTGAVGTGVVFWYGTALLRAGEVTTGDLVAFMTYVGLFWEPISRLGSRYSSLLVAMASSERIFSFLDTPPIVADRPGAVSLPSIKGNVEFDHVTFEYEKGRPVLHDINFVVKPGQSVALVGHTGSGKTTITNLIARFYDPTRGHVRIDGHDLSGVTVASLRRQLAIVLQDPFIFSGTIRDNIRYGRLDATDDEIVAAARAVSAHSFIT